MELIIAIILALILIVKCCSSKSAGKEADRKCNEERISNNSWRARVTDRALEQQLKSFIWAPENRDKVLQEVNEVYEGIYASKPFDELLPKEQWCKAKPGWTPAYHEEIQKEACKLNPTNALRIMMAKHGKIVSYDADCSTMYSPNRITGGISADSPLTAYVLVWCANELNRHGVNEKFVVPSIGKYGAGGLHWETQ